MAFTFTDRVYLGTIADISGFTGEPTDPPAAGATVIQNVYTFSVDSIESRTIRFNVLELDFDGMVPASVTVVPYHSRVNPAPTNYGTTETTDSWVSLGGQAVKKTPDGSGGNSIEVRARGAKFITFKVMSPSGEGAIPVKVYGLLALQGVS